MAEPTPRWTKPKTGFKDSNWLEYVPERLAEPGRPELADLPQYVAFGAVDDRDGGHRPATSVYLPDWRTLHVDDEKMAMIYRNFWGGRSEITIGYDRRKRSWAGIKIVDGVEVGRSYGGSWQVFFKHLAILGLAHGEPCWFHDVPA